MACRWHSSLPTFLHLHCPGTNPLLQSITMLHPWSWPLPPLPPPVPLTAWSVMFLESSQEVTMPMPSPVAPPAFGAAPEAGQHGWSAKRAAEFLSVPPTTPCFAPASRLLPPSSASARRTSIKRELESATDNSDSDGAGGCGSGAGHTAKVPKTKVGSFSPVPLSTLRPGTVLGDALARAGFDAFSSAAIVNGVIQVPMVPQELLCELVRGPDGVFYRCRLCTYQSKTRSNVNTHTKVRVLPCRWLVVPCLCDDGWAAAWHVVARLRRADGND